MNSAELKRSHYLPAGLYKAVSRGFSPHDSAPVVLDLQAGTCLYSNDQPRKHLLCSDCEDRFDKNGEDPVIADCYRDNGKFRLREILRKAAPSLVSSRGGVYFSEQLPPTLNVRAYVYFAVSILWRGSVADWPGPYGYYRNALGPKYAELFRRFLLGETEFPAKVHVAVYVDFDVPSSTGLAPPVKSRELLHGLYVNSHSFMIPEMRFVVMIGGETNRILRNLREHTTSDIIFYEWRFSKSDLYRQTALKAQRSEPKGKLERKLSVDRARVAD